MYVDRANGFIGTSLKKEEYLFDCSPYDELLVVRRDCTAMVSKVSEKAFAGGKDILHVEIFDGKDRRRTYNLIYQDGEDERVYIKRFQMGGYTRDKEYPLGKGGPKSKVLYLSSCPNGEAEVVEVMLKPRPRIKLDFQADFAELEVKGRSALGKLLTKFPVRTVKKISEGKSTLGAMQLWYQQGASVVSMQPEGLPLGPFEESDLILVVRGNGKAQLFQPAGTVAVGGDVVHVVKLDREAPYTAVWFDGESLSTYLKRFTMDELQPGREQLLTSEHADSRLLFFSADPEPKILVEYQPLQGKALQREILQVAEVPLRGFKAKGQRLAQVRRIRKIGEAPAALLSGAMKIEKAVGEQGMRTVDIV